MHFASLHASTSPQGGGEDSYAPRRVLQPRPRLVIDERRERLAHARVIGVEPGAFLVGQYLRLDEAEIDRRQRDRLELHHLALAARNLLRLAHHDEILDADAEFASLVEAGLVGTD